MRIILGVQPTTHCKYLADDRDIKLQLHMRFVKCIYSAHQSPNFISNSYFRLALLGSRSNVSNNISIGTCTPLYRNVNDMLVDEETKSITNVIKELLYIKHCLIVSTNRFVLNMSEIDQIITQLYTE